MIRTPYGIQSERNYTPGKPVRDKAYLRFVKSFPCAACGRTWCIDPAHTGPHGLGQKASDLSCIPLCRIPCHREFDADPQGFREKFGLDVTRLIVRLNAAYELIQRRKSA